MFLALIVFSTARGFATPDIGYLPRVGPAALRFYTLPKPPANHVVLPPPAPVAPAPVLPKPEKVALSNTPAPVPVKVETNAPALSDKVSPEPVVPQQLIGPTSSDGIISPQMLLKYFGKNPHGDAPAAGPTDAASTKGQGSSASYSIGP